MRRRLRQASDRTFRSLRIRNFRLFWTGMTVSLCGTWMQYVAQDWLIIHLGGRGTAIGLATGLQFVPMLVAGAWGGVVADRLDKRRLLMATQSSFAVLAVTLGMLTALGVVRIWMVLLFAFLVGCVTVLDVPARQAFVGELVGPDELANAVGLNSAIFNAARIVGPALAAVTIAAVGVAPAFFVNAASYVGPLVALAALDVDRLLRAERQPRRRGQVREGIRYVMATPSLRFALALMAVVSLFGMNFRVLLPILARFTFDGGPGTYGAMAVVMAAGALAGALVAAARSRPTERLLAGLALAFGLLIVATSAMPGVGLTMALLAPTGAASITFLATSNSLLQTRSVPAMRGRVMALYALVFLGSNPLGAPLVGWVSERWGPRLAMGLGGAATAVAGIVAIAVVGSRARLPVLEAPPPTEVPVSEVEPAVAGVAGA